MNENQANKLTKKKLYKLIEKYNVTPPRTTTKMKLVQCYVQEVLPKLTKRENNRKKRAMEEEEGEEEEEEEVVLKKKKKQSPRS